LLDAEFPWGERGEGSTQNCLSGSKNGDQFTPLGPQAAPQFQTILAETLTRVLHIRAKKLICYDLAVTVQPLVAG
jgi:hypothetical protein